MNPLNSIVVAQQVQNVYITYKLGEILRIINMSFSSLYMD